MFPSLLYHLREVTTADRVFCRDLERLKKIQMNINNVVNLSDTVQQYDTGGFLMCVVRPELGAKHYAPL